MAAQTRSFDIKQFAPLVSFAVLFAVWQLVSMHGDGSVLPSPAKVLEQAVTMVTAPLGSRPLWEHVAYSMRRVLSGYLIAISLGVPLGLARGWIPLVDKIVKPIFELLRPIPPLAWIPIAILWLGTGEGPMVFICFIAAFIIATLTSYTGMKYVDPLLIDAARSFGATRRQQFFNVALPSSLPAVFTGLQQGIGVSWMGVVAAELVGAHEGVGYIIIHSMDMAQPEMTIVGMIIIGSIGALLALGLRGIERRVCTWRRHLV